MVSSGLSLAAVPVSEARQRESKKESWRLHVAVPWLHYGAELWSRVGASMLTLRGGYHVDLTLWNARLTCYVLRHTPNASILLSDSSLLLIK